MQKRGRPCEQDLYRGFDGESRFPTTNYSNDIASTYKVEKSVNGCLQVKYANISMIINNNFKCLPLLLFVLVTVHSRTMVEPKQLV